MLIEFGYQSDKLTLFLWEGVSMYLNQTAVEEMLQALSCIATSGACLVFDCCERHLLDGSKRYPVVEKYLRFLAKKGEPPTWGIEIEKLPALLRDNGFQLQDCRSAKQLREFYQIETNTQVLEHLLGLIYVVKAAVS